MDIAWDDLAPQLEALLDVDAAQRAAQLAAIATADQERAQALRRLLNAADQTRWEQQMAGAAAQQVVETLGSQLLAAEDLTGEVLGAYRLLSVLGCGGMGTVYLAERADGSYEQQVALKVLPGRSLNSMAAERFLAERQILARLEHPNIARLMDGGMLDEHTPYLVMEYVNGQDLESFCSSENLRLVARINLFLQLLDAVQFAHRQLIVHGDLKPENVIVGQDRTLKLLDFGVAQTLDPTNQDQVTALTPNYASPELLAGAPMSVSTDIYALGVLLFRLATNSAPYDVNGLAPAAAQRALTDLQTTPLIDAPVLQAVDPELRHICARAMAHDPAMRYPVVEALRQDLLDRDNHRPVSAMPVGRLYRSRKFVARNKGAVAAASAVVLAIAIGTTNVVIQADRAEREAYRAEQVTEFVASLFDAANPFGAWADERSVSDLLNYANNRIESELGQTPLAKAKVLALIGEAFAGNGNYDRGVELLQAALATVAGSDSDTTAAVRNKLAHALIEQGDYPAGQEQAEQALSYYQAMGAEKSLDQADALTNLAVAVSRQGDTEKARDLHQQALAFRIQLLPDHHVAIADSQMSLASVQAKLGNTAEVLALNRAAHARYRSHYGAAHPMTMRAMNGIASGEFLAGRFAEAEIAFATLLQQSQARLGPEHPELALLFNNLGRVQVELGKFDAAFTHLNLALQQVEGAPEQRMLSISARFNQALLQAELGQFESAEANLDAAVAQFRSLLGSGHPLTYRSEVQRAAAGALARATGSAAELDRLIDQPICNSQNPVCAAAIAARLELQVSRLASTDASVNQQSVSLTTQDSAALDTLLETHGPSSWRHTDVALLKARIVGSDSEVRRHSQTLVQQLPPSSLRHQRAMQWLKQSADHTKRRAITDA